MAFQDRTKAKRSAVSNGKSDLEAGQLTPGAGAGSEGKPSNEQVLNVAFYSFVGFLLIQAIFALIANSQSMLADSEAMSVDAITYLFNLCSERMKNRPPSEEELRLTPAERGYQRQLRRLHLEMIPPSISVFALLCITIYTLHEACSTLFGWDGEEDDDDVSIPIMLFFSGFNLLLDVLNTYFFTKAGMNFGFTVVKTEHRMIQSSMSGKDDPSVMTEAARLLPSTPSHHIPYGSADAAVRDEEAEGALVNLNMCSAWTHVCADTLRSTAVLVAAGIATVFQSLDGVNVDAVAAIVVSVIILVSLVPLVQGLVLTGIEIRRLKNNPPRTK